ncbi:hypothetical protein [Pedobacter arcticus]|uniref:hypothetical protein n=1 Tax=Pedobacter arcticus TaxID=752140 RepID=UPI0002F5B22A|nr:hypothetical protein [Pedobacter arcticus]
MKPLTAAELFDLLKKELATYIDAKIDSGLTVEYAHVQDIINISFPEIIDGVAFTLTVTDEEVAIEKSKEEFNYDLTLLETHLTSFLKEKCE